MLVLELVMLRADIHLEGVVKINKSDNKQKVFPAIILTIYRLFPNSSVQ